jgi:hypothetical protein
VKIIVPSQKVGVLHVNCGQSPQFTCNFLPFIEMIKIILALFEKQNEVCHSPTAMNFLLWRSGAGVFSGFWLLVDGQEVP